MAGWLEPTIVLFPFAAWMFAGVGLPWALALLPRELWRERVTVLAVGLALGPVGLTAVMFLLGTFGTITLGGTLVGSALVAALGAGLAWRRRAASPAGPDAPAPGPRLSRAEGLLIAGIALLLLINVIVTAYWPFLAYDALWVYAYNAKIFTMERAIPSDMGYYPQLVPLGYTFMQQAWEALHPGAAFDDHAARTIIPWFNMATALVAYVLGRRVFGSRRTGLLAAALWMFYPHVAAWYGSGDLEIPLTLYVTGAAAFFIDAWQSGRARSAIVSGLLLAGALWTKPTGGALALGVMLSVAGWWAAVRFRPAAGWPKLRLAILAGIASAPIGGMWYLRNVALGHTAVVFPADYWHSLAQRSGQELGWPLLIAALAVFALLVRPAPDRARRARIALPLAALALLLAGTLPTALNLDILFENRNAWEWVKGNLPAARRFSPLEAGLVMAGAALLAWAGRSRWRALPRARREAVLLLWALLLPYAVVWFLDFSYHYRLSFAIVPLLAVQAAALIDGAVWPWLAAGRVRRWVGAALIAGAVGLAAFVALEHSARYWRDGGLPDDTAKYDAGNPALMHLVHALEDYAAEHGPPVIAIPGEERLPFFFPTWDIRNNRAADDLPTRLEDLAGADIFVHSSTLMTLLQDAGKWPTSLAADADVGAAYARERVTDPQGEPWPTVLQPIPLNPNGELGVFDGSFLFMAYTVHPEARTNPIQPGGPAPGRTIIGGFAEYLGHDVTGLVWYRGDKAFISLYWRPTEEAPPPKDYSVFIHLLDGEGNLVAGWDGEPLMGAYHTRYWRPGETLLDWWEVPIPADIPTGPVELRIGLYDPLTGERLPVTIDGQPAGDALTISTRIEVK